MDCNVSSASRTHQVFEHWLDKPRNPDYILESSCVRIVCIKGNSPFYTSDSCGAPTEIRLC